MFRDGSGSSQQKEWCDQVKRLRLFEIDKADTAAIGLGPSSSTHTTSFLHYLLAAAFWRGLIEIADSVPKQNCAA